MKNKISGVILTKNEEKNIKDCLQSLMWCGEVIVVDDYSEDKTVKKCQMSNVKCQIYQRSLNGDFAAQRNYGLSKAEGDWVFFVDTDERVPEALASEIINLKLPASQRGEQISSKINGYYVKRRDFMWGKELRYGETGGIKLLRLARKDSGEWQGKVHEEWVIKGETEILDNYLLHYPHQNINEFLKEINFYTGIRAKELFDEGVRSGFLEIILYTKAKFVQNYFLRLGIWDGMPGLISAILMSLHSFMVRGKLWLLWKK